MANMRIFPQPLSNNEKGTYDMVLDYSEYIIESGLTGVVNYRRQENNTHLFKHRSVCPFCRIEIKNSIYFKTKHGPEWLFSGSFFESERVLQCPNCGWWEYSYENSSDSIDEGVRANEIKYASAILRAYNDNSMDIPITELRKYLEKKPDLLYSINPHKLEEVVRSVFKDFYPSCEVKTFGQTRDGGRDGLIIMDDGSHHLLQVKRRTHRNHTEGISQLRELIGASVIEDNLSGCIYVTTAAHFSDDAQKYAQQVVSKKVVETFDLINYSEFLHMMELTKDHLPNKWRELLSIKE